MSNIKKFFGLGLIFLFVVTLIGPAHSKVQQVDPYFEGTRDAVGVCPPFHLLDEKGNVINPVSGKNADEPYSTKQTCGQCHNYDRITSGYHFQQGKGRDVPEGFKKRYPWVTSPAQYGGRW